MTSTTRFGATCLLLGGTVAMLHMNAKRGFQPLVEPLSSIGTEIDGWTSTEDPPLTDAVRQSLNATSVLSRTYRRGDRSLNLWIAFYADQRAGEVMHSPKHCLPGAGWDMMPQGTVALTAGARSVRINDYLLTGGGNRQRMLYWYQGRQRVIASEYSGKLFLMWDAMRYGQTSGSIVRVIFADDPASFEDAQAFAQRVILQMGRCLGAG